MDEDDSDLMNRPTVDYSERAVGRVPQQYVPGDALTPVPTLQRAGRLTEKARSRTISRDRLGGRQRNNGKRWPA